VTQQSLRLAPSTIERLRDVTWRVKTWRVEKKRQAIVISTLAALLISAAAGWRVSQWRAERVANQPAAPARVNAGASPYELFQQGLTSLERFDKEGNIDTAFQAFNTALSKDPNYAPAYAGLGMAYAAQFQFNRDKSLLDLAVQNASKAVTLDGYVAINRVSLGRAYVDRGDYDLAEPELDEALTLDQLNADAYHGLADIRQAKGNGAEAERLYKRAIELRPGDWRLPYALGIFYYRLSRFAEAEKTFQEVIVLAPDCYMVHRDLGAVYHIQGRFADASSEFQTALQIRPSASTYSNLGTSLFFQGLYSDSVKAMEKAVELGANNYQTWANLGDAYRQMPGNQDKAREAFRAAIQLARGELSSNLDDAGLLSRLAVYLAKGGEKQAALDQAEVVGGLVKTGPVLARLALAYEICGRREQALNALEAALKEGYSLEEISRDPDLLEMRKDPNYRRLVVRSSARTQK
jgi:serine/threonine-protein kinase